METQCDGSKGELKGDAAKDLEPWLKRLMAQIRRSWFTPASVASKKVNVRLRFVVHRDGRITDLTVYESSSVAEFDQSALSAVTAANPTEPFPPQYSSPNLAICLTFEFTQTPGG